MNKKEVKNEQTKIIDEIVESYSFYYDLLYNTFSEMKKSKPDDYIFLFGIHKKFANLMTKILSELKGKVPENVEEKLQNWENENVEILNKIYNITLENLFIHDNMKDMINKFALFSYSVVKGFIWDLFDIIT